MLRPERLAVAMAVAEATHHSSRGQRTATAIREVEEQVAHFGLRAQKTPPPGERPGCLADPAPQRSDRSQRRFAGNALPTFALPSLAGSAAEAVDASTLTFLLGQNLALQKLKGEEEKRREEEEEEEAKLANEEDEVSAAVPAALPPRHLGTVFRVHELGGIIRGDDGRMFSFRSSRIALAAGFRVSFFIKEHTAYGVMKVY